MPNAKGDFYLAPTLSFPEGWYRASQHGDIIELTSKCGSKHYISETLFLRLRQDGPRHRVRTAARKHLFAQEQGILGALGYRVGERGLTTHQRRKLLIDALTLPLNRLPQVGNRAYLEEWGEARSQQRLGKMIDCLSSFAATARNRAQPPTMAIQDWESDLLLLTG